MKKLIAAIALIFAVTALAGCAAVPPEKVESELAKIERGINLASALVDAAANAGALRSETAQRIRTAVANARIALALARDAAAAGQRARAEALARRATSEMESVSDDLPADPAPPG